MKTRRLFPLSILVSLTLFALSACSIDVARNTDGSLSVTSVMTEEQLGEELRLAMADRPNLKSLSADLRDGYVAVSGVRANPDTGEEHEITFRLDLGVENGHLTATISEFMRDGQPFDETKIAQWNEKIAQRLEKRAEKHPNRSLLSVMITENDLTLVWRVETRQSQED